LINRDRAISTYGTGTLPGGGQVPFLATKDRAGTIPGLSHVPGFVRDLVRTPRQATCRHQGAGGLRQSSLAAALAEKLEQGGSCVGG